MCKHHGICMPSCASNMALAWCHDAMLLGGLPRYHMCLLPRFCRRQGISLGSQDLRRWQTSQCKHAGLSWSHAVMSGPHKLGAVMLSRLGHTNWVLSWSHAVMSGPHKLGAGGGVVAGRQHGGQRRHGRPNMVVGPGGEQAARLLQGATGSRTDGWIDGWMDRLVCLWEPAEGSSMAAARSAGMCGMIGG
jgi:hypothetical protein